MLGRSEAFLSITLRLRWTLGGGVEACAIPNLLGLKSPEGSRGEGGSEEGGGRADFWGGGVGGDRVIWFGVMACASQPAEQRGVSLRNPLPGLGILAWSDGPSPAVVWGGLWWGCEMPTAPWECWQAKGCGAAPCSQSSPFQPGAFPQVSPFCQPRKAASIQNLHPLLGKGPRASAYLLPQAAADR